ncbi:RNA helicase [Savitreella phatthalungensis]
MLRTRLCEVCRLSLRKQQLRTLTTRPSTSGGQRSRPSFQQLSKNVGKPMLRDGTKRTQQLLQPTQGRLSRTGKSVLTAIPLQDRTRRQDMTIDDLKLRPDVSTAIRQGVLSDLSYIKPTSIQALAIPRLLSPDDSRKTFLLAAETGSGKTLAYLAPTIHRLKQAEEGETQPVRLPGRPRALIVVPSAELVTQVGHTVKSMAHHAKLSTVVLHPRFTQKRAGSAVLDKPVDLLVATPHQLSVLSDNGSVKLDNLDTLIVDEADTLFDKSFTDLMAPLLKQTATSKRMVLCSATIPRSLDAYLRQHVPDIERLVTSKVHTIPRRIATRFVDVDREFNGNKQTALHQILRDLSLDQTEPGREKKVIVFVNRRERIEEVADFLREKEFQVLSFSRDDSARKDVLERFLKTDVDAEGMRVMVTTDLASRGIDTTSVKNVILYEVPHSTIDFIHRLGRTGRAGRRGTAFVFVTKHRGDKWVRDVRDTIIRGMPLV